mgnify:CR=1 FL=1
MRTEWGNAESAGRKRGLESVVGRGAKEGPTLRRVSPPPNGDLDREMRGQRGCRS